MKKIKMLFKNIKYLMRNDIGGGKRQIIEYIQDNIPYEIDHDWKPELNVLDYEKTLDKLLQHPKSFCRFGDGEIEIINGHSIPFQKYNKELADKMLYILANNIENLYVGINYNYFHSTRNMLPVPRRFYINHAPKYRKYFIEYSNTNREYIAAGFNQLYMSLDKYDFDNYYKKAKLIFKDKEVVVFIGKGIKEKFEYNVFEQAKSVEFVEGPNMNAYDEYELLLDKAKSYDKSKILCFILGPTSKVLVYDLSQLGYLAYDIGHLMKDYDAYMRQLPRDDDGIEAFFKPD